MNIRKLNHQNSDRLLSVEEFKEKQMPPINMRWAIQKKLYRDGRGRGAFSLRQEDHDRPRHLLGLAKRKREERCQNLKMNLL